jgi:hypothetical protein
MHDVLESVQEQGQEDHGNNPLILPVSVTISILAVFVALATLLGHRSNTEKLFFQGQSSDQWNYYQAKNIRLHEMQVAVDEFEILGRLDKEKAAAMKEKYQKEVERYGKEKDAISEKAKELENERDVQGRRADRFEGGEALLEIALVICSLTLLTKKRLFWYGGMLIALGGLLFAGRGFLIH